MNETLNVLKQRRGCKSYQDRQITDAELDAVLEAGTYAPTGRNQQSPILVAVQNREDLDTLRRLNAAVAGTDTDPFYGAPTVVVVLADKNWPTRVYDGSCVMENMMIAAEALGLGSRWIHRAREVFESEEGKALLKSWGVEGEYEGIGNCILGYWAWEKPAAAPRKEHYIYKVK